DGAEVHPPPQEPQRRRRGPLAAALAGAAEAEAGHVRLALRRDQRAPRLARGVPASEPAPAHPAAPGPPPRTATPGPRARRLQELAPEGDLIEDVCLRSRTPGGKPLRRTSTSFSGGLLSASLKERDQDGREGPPSSWRCSQAPPYGRRARAHIFCP